MTNPLSAETLTIPICAECKQILPCGCPAWRSSAQMMYSTGEKQDEFANILAPSVTETPKETPRTDAEALKWGPHEGVMNVVIPASFARTLELELQAAQGRVEELERGYAELYDDAQSKLTAKCFENTELRTQLEAAKGDAERYRWLRDKACDIAEDESPAVAKMRTYIDYFGYPPDGYEVSEPVWLCGEELDAAIDSARGGG